jgi:serine/threonine protein kinase
MWSYVAVDKHMLRMHSSTVPPALHCGTATSHGCHFRSFCPPRLLARVRGFLLSRATREQVVDAPAMLYLVMEHAPGGSLLDFVRARKRLAEADAVPILQQVVASLAYCHAREVVHRDIKLENILMDGGGTMKRTMKLIDFGLSAFFVPGKPLRVHCGSPSYAAPEIVARKHYEGPPVVSSLEGWARVLEGPSKTLNRARKGHADVGELDNEGCMAVRLGSTVRFRV